MHVRLNGSTFFALTFAAVIIIVICFKFHTTSSAAHSELVSELWRCMGNIECWKREKATDLYNLQHSVRVSAVRKFLVLLKLFLKRFNCNAAKIYA